MKETVNRLEASVDEVKKKLMGFMVEGGGMETMTADDLESAQMFFRLLNTICDVVREQSEIIEQLSLNVNTKTN